MLLRLGETHHDNYPYHDNLDDVERDEKIDEVAKEDFLLPSIDQDIENNL